MNDKKKNKALFLEQIKRTPIIQVACDMVGVTRTTIHRWRKDDPQFAKDLDDALRDGRSLVTDAAISQLLTAIKNGDLGAVKFWLKHFDENFKTKVEFLGTMRQIREELTEEEAAMIGEALLLIGLPDNDGESDGEVERIIN
jgi:hypothetical protein